MSDRLTKKLTQNEIDIASEILGRDCQDVYGYTQPSKDKEKDITEIFTKLGKLEDIEEELGCPLEVIFKAIKQRYIYVESAYNCDLREECKEINCVVKYDSLVFSYCNEIALKEIDYFTEFANKWCFQFYHITDDDYCIWDCFLVRLSDYKKTWWLKED